MKLSKFYDWCIEHRHAIFLVGLILFFILPEIFDRVFNITITFPVVMSILVFSSLLLLQTSPSKRIISYALLILLAFFQIFWNSYQQTGQTHNLAYVLLFIYFSSITYVLFKDLLRSKEITGSVIIGAFAGYFLMGVIWFFIFGFLDSIYPDTTSIDMTNLDVGEEDMLYFSFITLTTIGYGDFSPTSSLRQKIAIL